MNRQSKRVWASLKRCNRNIRFYLIYKKTVALHSRATVFFITIFVILYLNNFNAPVVCEVLKRFFFRNDATVNPGADEYSAMGKDGNTLIGLRLQLVKK